MGSSLHPFTPPWKQDKNATVPHQLPLQLLEPLSGNFARAVVPLTVKQRSLSRCASLLSCLVAISVGLPLSLCSKVKRAPIVNAWNAKPTFPFTSDE